jgi:hypothetical protein
VAILGGEDIQLYTFLTIALLHPRERNFVPMGQSTGWIQKPDVTEKRKISAITRNQIPILLSLNQ